MRKGLVMRALLDRYWRLPSPSFKKQQARGGREPPPEGCLAVYVGAARQRFVVRTECVNHRLFRALLEDAEEARGYCYAPDGPLQLPCDAEAFARVVEAIEREMAEERVGCGGGGVRGHSPAVVHSKQLVWLISSSDFQTAIVDSYSRSRVTTRGIQAFYCLGNASYLRHGNKPASRLDAARRGSAADADSVQDLVPGRGQTLT
ncbi:hypothetical protein EJB05_48048, partial [Eragrostis curvula]